MCGIAGQINFDVSEAVRGEDLAAMVGELRHRGPDAEGIELLGQAGLAHRRLSIIDLSSSANQPMSNEDGSVWIVFNGEIYNFQDLHKELSSRGHRFRSRSDTEALLHLYEEEGERMLGRLRGMFAFAIWDKRRQRLFAACDRAGQKPFKYYLDGKRFVFASELKALLRHPDVRTEIEPEDIHQYLGFGYVLSPNTGFRNIKKLPPAHYLLCEKGRVTIERYWQLDYRRQTNIDYEQALEEIVARLEDAVRVRLVSDVPLGAFLSGGVDSSAVVGLMARHSSSPVRTFSIGFDYEEMSELPHARQVAELFQTEHTEEVVEVRAAELLPKLAALYEEPYSDSSALPSYRLAEITRKSVTVALNGDGGDENFFGYQRYFHYDWLRRMIERGRHFGFPLLLRTAQALPGSFLHRIRHRAKVIENLIDAPPEKVFGRLNSIFSDEMKESIYRPEFREWARKKPNDSYMRPDYGKAAAGADPLHHALLWDFEHYLPDDLCVKMDIATMAHGLEARSPFLDHLFLEFCASLPREWKYRRGDKKHILKVALQKLLPREILYRKKQGFGIPIQQWFRGPLQGMVKELLLSPDAKVSEYARPDALERMVDSHLSGRADEGHRLWSLLTLELWLRAYGRSVS